MRLESRTRSHAFVEVMMAYNVIHALAKHWYDLDLATKEGLDQLATLCLTELHFPNKPVSHRLPTPSDSVQQLFDAAQVRLPSKIVPPVCVRRNH